MCLSNQIWTTYCYKWTFALSVRVSTYYIESMAKNNDLLTFLNSDLPRRLASRTWTTVNFEVSWWNILAEGLCSSLHAKLALCRQAVDTLSHGFYERRRSAMNLRGSLDPQSFRWSRNLRVHEHNQQKLEKSMESKRNRRSKKLLDDQMISPEEETSSQSPSQTASQTPVQSPQSPKVRKAVREAKKLLRILNLDHMISDVDEEEVEKKPEPKRVSIMNGKGEKRTDTRRVDWPPTPRGEDSERDSDNSSVWSSSRKVSCTKVLQQKLNERREINARMSRQHVVRKREDTDMAVEMTRNSKPVPRDGQNGKEPNGKFVRTKEVPNEQVQLELECLRNTMAEMKKYHAKAILEFTENLEQHTRQIGLLHKSNSKLSLKVETLEKEIRVLSAMQFVSSSLPWRRLHNTSIVTNQRALELSNILTLKYFWKVGDKYDVWISFSRQELQIFGIYSAISSSEMPCVLWWADFFFTWNSGFQVIWKLSIHSMCMLNWISLSSLKSPLW